MTMNNKSRHLKKPAFLPSLIMQKVYNIIGGTNMYLKGNFFEMSVLQRQRHNFTRGNNCHMPILSTCQGCD